MYGRHNYVYDREAVELLSDSPKLTHIVTIFIKVKNTIWS